MGGSHAGRDFIIHFREVPISITSSAHIEVNVLSRTITDLLGTSTETSPFECLILRPLELVVALQIWGKSSYQRSSRT